MAIALVDHCKYAAGGSTGGTSAAMNSTGANLLVAAVGNVNAYGTFVDSKSNVWTRYGPYGDISLQAISYWISIPSSVGSAHTFSPSGSAVFATCCVAAFSGVATAFILGTPIPSNTGGSLTSIQAGSLTPAAANCLVLSALSMRTTNTVSVNGGFTITDQCPFIAATAIGSALAYLIQTSAAAANPTWSWTGANDASSAGASIQPPVSAGGGAGGFLIQ